MFKWYEKLKKAIDEANSPRAASEWIVPERPPAPELTRAQIEHLVTMMRDFEGRGLKPYPDVDRHAAAQLIFEEYWNDWGDAPSRPSTIGTIPRHLMLNYLASEEIDWGDSQPEDISRILQNAYNSVDKFEGDAADLIWNLTRITGGDIALEEPVGENLRHVIIAGKRYPIPWNKVSTRDFMDPLFGLTDYLPSKNKNRFRAFDRLDLAAADPQHL